MRTAPRKPLHCNIRWNPFVGGIHVARQRIYALAFKNARFLHAVRK